MASIHSLNARCCHWLLIVAGLLAVKQAAAWDKTYNIGGPQPDFSSMAELLRHVNLGPGDTVNIFPGVYRDTWLVQSQRAAAEEEEVAS